MEYKLYIKYIFDMGTSKALMKMIISFKDTPEVLLKVGWEFLDQQFLLFYCNFYDHMTMYKCFAQTSTFEGVVGKIWPRFLQVIAFRRPINCPHTSTSSLQKVDSICLAMQSPQQQRKKERKNTPPLTISEMWTLCPAMPIGDVQPRFCSN